MTETEHLKQLEWIGSSRDDLRMFPDNARRDIGAALYEAQKGRKPDAAKPLKGFSGAGVLEVRQGPQITASPGWPLP